MRKLTQEQADTIRSSDESARVLAERYNVSVATIYDIRNGHWHRPPGEPRPKRGKKPGRPRKHFPQPCECGCGEMTSPGKRFRVGHCTRVNDARKNLKRSVAFTDIEWLERTLAKCQLEDRGFESPCLIWRGLPGPNGYASLASRYGKQTTRHRVLYGILHPEADLNNRSMHVHHRCEQRDCLAPWHLVGLSSTTHIGIHKSPLSDADVAEARRLHAEGMSVRELHKRYPVVLEHSLRNILKGHRRAIKEPTATCN